MSDRHF